MTGCSHAAWKAACEQPGQQHSFILFNYQSPNDTVQKILDMAGDILAEKGFLR